jgi:hypothetical protein
LQAADNRRSIDPDPTMRSPSNSRASDLMPSALSIERAA